MRNLNEVDADFTLNRFKLDHDAVFENALELLEIAKSQESLIIEFKSLVDMEMGEALEKLVKLVEKQ